MADTSVESLSEYHDIVSKQFVSEEERFRFYNTYDLQKGLSVQKSYVEWDGGNQEICLRKMVCSREGFREAKHINRANKKRRPRNISRVGCKAKLVIAQDRKTGKWFVKDFIDEHSHQLAPPDLACLLRSHRRIRDEQKADIAEMEISGIRKHQIMDILETRYGGYDKVGFIARDIYNFCYRYNQGTIDAGDAKTMISHLGERQQRDPQFFFKYLVDVEGHLKGLFWSDSQSQIDYAAFGDVVIFDSTYRTNKYNMPFVPFVGVNHHRSTVVFGCGIISHETSEAYEWMLRTLSLAMGQKHPISVITNGDLAMQKAIRVVWPNSNHRLCVFHVEQNISRHLHNDEVKAKFKGLLYDRCSVDEIEIKWELFLVKHKVKSEESWLHQMYQMRKLCCDAYQVGHCFLGMRSNQRSESLNAMLHEHLDGKMTLVSMLQHYERNLSDLRRNEAVLDIVALETVPFIEASASIFEKDAAWLFTPTVFDVVKFSIRDASECNVMEVLDGCDATSYIVYKKGSRGVLFYVDVEMNERSVIGIRCSCSKIECFGTPCSHIFHVLSFIQAACLPICCVRRRWTTSAKYGLNTTRKSTLYDYSVNLDRYRELRNLSHAASFRASQSIESYERLKKLLSEEVATNDLACGDNDGVWYGPVLPQTQQSDSDTTGMVLDPIRVPGRGAPKKRLQAMPMKKKRSTNKCGHCNGEGHNRRTCSKLKEIWPR